MYKRKLYQAIASTIQAYHNCVSSGNDWADKHEETLHKFESDYLPSGSGVDCGTKIDLDCSTGDKIVLTFEYHHMNDNGMYDGWTSHTVTVKPSLQFGFTLKISGTNRNGDINYFYDLFSSALETEVEL